MIRFGMALMEIVEQLTKGFMKATGKQPGNLEKLKIQQEAVQRFKEMNKVMDMQGRPIDPSKPIMGGSQQGEALKSGIMKATGARPRQVLSEDEIRQKLLKNNEEGLASMKSKIDDPEKKAMGGRIGYAGGSDMGTVADSKGNVGPSKGGYQGGGTGPVERPTGGGGGNDNNTTYDYTIPKQILKQTAINTVKNLGRRELMNTLGLAKFSNPIGIAMALKGLYDQTQNPTLTEEEAMGGGITGMDISTLQSSPYENMASQFKANGGRIGYKIGAGKKGVQALLDLVRDKFGKKAATTADKAPIPPKTLERNMFKKADKRLNDKRMLDDDEYQDFLDEVGGADQLEAYDFDGTVGSAKRILKEQKEYMDDMFMEYKKGNLDPVAGDKSPARKRFLEKKLDEMEMSGDKRLMTVDEIEELSSFDLGSEMDVAKSLAPKMVERLELKQKYPGITDDLLDKILIDDNMQRKAEVLATMDEAIKMMEKGKSSDEIVETFKNVTRTKQADGGRIGFDDGDFVGKQTRTVAPQDFNEKLDSYYKSISKPMSIPTPTGNPEIITSTTPIEKSPAAPRFMGSIFDFTNIEDEEETENKADGGRIGLKAGMTKRGFLKLMGGVGASIGAAKSGIFSGLGKGAGKTVAKEVVKETAGTYPPPYFFKLAEKIKFMGDDITKKAATKDREIVTKYKDYEMSEDVATGEIVIKKRNEGVFYDQDGIISDEYIVYKPGQADELTKGKKPPPEYDEYTVRPDADGKLRDSEDGLDSIDEILEEVGDSDSMTIKKASGGIARMLGE